MFAELLVQAQGHGDAEEIAKTMSLVDIIYQMKKVEEEKKAEPEPEPESSSTEEPEKKAEPEPEKKAEPEPEKKAEPSSTEEPEIVVKIKDFWSRLTHDSDSD
jgi:hypothetical protein